MDFRENLWVEVAKKMRIRVSSLVEKTRKDKRTRMRIETLLNHVEPIKGFVYSDCELNRETDTLEVVIRSREGCRVACPVCGKRSTVYV